jgi:hypothetical protein
MLLFGDNQPPRTRKQKTCSCRSSQRHTECKEYPFCSRFRFRKQKRALSFSGLFFFSDTGYLAATSRGSYSETISLHGPESRRHAVAGQANAIQNAKNTHFISRRGWCVSKPKMGILCILYGVGLTCNCMSSAFGSVEAEDMQLQVKPTPYRMQRIPIFGFETHQPRREM